MSAHPLAGQAVPESLRINVPRLVADYYTVTPDPAVPDQVVSFGTSGHRGSSFRASFNEAHILAITRAVCEFRRSKGIDGPLFVGMDSHALSEPAMRTVLEVLAADGVSARFQKGFGYTPTPVISHAILTHNKGRASGLADGMVITPSHNPPEDGGIKYNPPHGGPAGTDVTAWIEKRANELLASPGAIARVPLARALKLCGEHDYIEPYVRDLAQAIDMEAIARAGVRIGVDPLGGAGLPFWEPIAGLYGLDINVANAAVDPAFMFMSLDKDGKIRMDCSSSSAMAKLIALKDSFSVAFANDPDADRHGIVTARHGLMNPNHYLAVAIDYLLGRRPGWNRESRIGKTLVTSSMVDRIAAAHGREVREVPVGFKWFVDDLLSGACCFGGEESAGASFLRRDGGVWTTDKDGILLNLLAAEITAVTGKDLGDIYLELEARHGSPLYERLQAPAGRKQRELLASLTPGQVPSSELAGESILAKLTHAPGNGAAIGGLKVVTENGWFAARPSGTEDMYKIYVESFRGREHLDRIKAEAQAMVDGVLSGA
ncbi:phosphoglucomutase (alpha-D-glucose-1,6-bisphosphate-dependent) [Desulfomicrobium orale]|uniref:Phosphoglucomutase n=1 Tax=Desulfomicrobium orale DSM 12838 TaxID=888061 RepID=A0A109W5F2_9BACT|nr:phosphoglucomutase (alpha-D-glucose-1,6-bisphosphate-dependent) [Desulfomicrobium orale]AMD91910.1 phosphoglucomutase [Desulfomicrobium orale DSM 12838]